MTKPKYDFKIILPAFCLFCIGLLILQSVSPHLFWTQLIFGLVSFLVYYLISQIDVQIMFSLHPLFSFFSTSFLVLTYIIGELTRGTHRWINFGFFSFQPSEIAKPFILISFVVIYSSLYSSKLKLLWITLLSLLPLGLIFFQPDLGTFLVATSGLLVVFFSRWPLKYSLSILIIISLISFPLYKFALKDYQRDRIITFLNPYADPVNKGYHVIQSVISVGSGGVLGKGLGQGSQSQLRFLPEQHTDFIFASLSEELGLVGGTMVLILYGYIFFRFYQTSQHTSSKTETSLILGLLGMLVFQVFVNIGMNIGIVPITGITLPLMSYGGSSLLSSAIILGLTSSIYLKSSTHFIH